MSHRLIAPAEVELTTVRALDERLRRLLGEGATDLVLELGETGILGLRACGRLCTMLHQLRLGDHGAVLRVVGAPRLVRSVLVMCAPPEVHVGL